MNVDTNKRPLQPYVERGLSRAADIDCFQWECLGEVNLTLRVSTPDTAFSVSFKLDDSAILEAQVENLLSEIRAWRKGKDVEND